MINQNNVKIKLENICKSFGAKKVLKNVSIDVSKGESLVIIGGSGSGKSVFIKNIIGLMQPTSGKILIDGVDRASLSSKEKERQLSKFGVLFQGGALFDSINVWKNISFSLLQSKRLNKKQALELAVEKLNSVGLSSDVANLYPSELSGGMQKRVALARAIADNPEVIFFDEPTTGLDPIMADVINELILKCSEELGATTVTITHNMNSVRKIANKVAMIYEGEIIWTDDVANLDNSDNEYVDQFINGRAEGPIKMQKWRK